MKVTYKLGEQCKWSVHAEDRGIPEPFRYVDVKVVRPDGTFMLEETLQLPETEAKRLVSSLSGASKCKS